jgi:hypothetical protein
LELRLVAYATSRFVLVKEALLKSELPAVQGSAAIFNERSALEM